MVVQRVTKSMTFEEESALLVLHMVISKILNDENERTFKKYVDRGLPDYSLKYSIIFPVIVT